MSKNRESKNLIVGLDIGTSKIACIVAEIRPEGTLEVIGAGMHQSSGMKKGMVVNIDATVAAIQRALEEAELMADCKIRDVYTGIAGGHIKSSNANGMIKIKDKEVAHTDIMRAVETASSISLPGDQQILHKISQNPEKVTNPGMKKIVRFYNSRGFMMGDLLTDVEEPLPSGNPVIAHHPMYDYMKKTYRPPYEAREIMVPIFKNGKPVYEPPSLQDVRRHAARELESLENETKRFTNPHLYKVSLSDTLYHIKKNLLLWHQENAANVRT